MQRPECPREEDVVRAIRYTDFDQKNNRFKSSLFVGSNVSVGRLAISSLDELFVIFHRLFDKRRKTCVTCAGEINVGVLQDLGKQLAVPMHISVEISPDKKFRAHAEIPQTIHRGLSLKIIKKLNVHDSPIYHPSLLTRLFRYYFFAAQIKSKKALAFLRSQ